MFASLENCEKQKSVTAVLECVGAHDRDSISSTYYENNAMGYQRLSCVNFEHTYCMVSLRHHTMTNFVVD